ncbi:biotin/lipoyl-binding protein, partial [Rhodobacterales bacterium HKCCE3408]|nr:biotin/lipoyl-binding protein [Rhodobacterales bacterium HKCCE3408]
MRIFPILTAALVCTILYFVILDRERLMAFLGAPSGPEAAETVATEPETAETDAEPEDGRVHVVVRRSTAQVTSDALLLRGRTEAAREVTVAAETSGRIVSEPIRAGASVTAGQTLCQIDSGTRRAALAEA